MRQSLKIATEDPLHTAESAARLLGVSPHTIRYWWSTSKLPRIKIGRMSRALQSDLLALIKAE
jgi:hypothetical protein